MYKDVSLELRNKIRQEMRIQESATAPHANHIGFLNFTFPEQSALYCECRVWKRIIDKYFKTTYGCYMLEKVGRFYGVRPFRICLYHVEFEVEHCHRESWKDWFDISGESDGKLRGVVGYVINERTFPEYAP